MMAKSINTNLKIRKAKAGDDKAILRIRNHPRVRKVSLNKKKIFLQDHRAWFKNYLRNKNNFCYLLEKGEKVVGYCRFDDKAGQREISIAIDPKFHRYGFGGILLRGSIKKIKNKKNIVALIKSDNPLSLSFFQKNNFAIFKKNKKVYYLIYRD